MSIEDKIKSKVCLACNKLLPISEFYHNKNFLDGYMSKCKTCVKNKIPIPSLYTKIIKYSNGIKYRQCTTCKQWFESNTDNFYVNCNIIDGLSYICKTCGKSQDLERNKNIKRKQQKRQWQIDNKEKIAIQNKKWRIENSDHLKQYMKSYKEQNKDEIYKRTKERACIRNEKTKLRRKIDVNFRLNDNMSSRIRYSLKHNKNNLHWENLVGYTLQELKQHLESQFEPGMNWNNYGLHGWHIDHIRPISTFNFQSYEDKQFKQCWSLANLRPLWAKDNWSRPKDGRDLEEKRGDNYE